MIVESDRSELKVPLAPEANRVTAGAIDATTGQIVPGIQVEWAVEELGWTDAIRF